MKQIRRQYLTPSQARHLVHMEFILTLIRLVNKDFDEYLVSVQG